MNVVHIGNLQKSLQIVVKFEDLQEKTFSVINRKGGGHE